MSSSEKCLFKSFAWFIVELFLWCYYKIFKNRLWVYILYGLYDLQIFPPILWVNFSNTSWYCLRHESFNFYQAQFIKFVLLVLLVSYLSNHCLTRSSNRWQKFTFMSSYEGFIGFTLKFRGFFSFFFSSGICIWLIFNGFYLFVNILILLMRYFLGVI